MFRLSGLFGTPSGVPHNPTAHQENHAPRTQQRHETIELQPRADNPSLGETVANQVQRRASVPSRAETMYRYGGRTASAFGALVAGPGVALMVRQYLGHAKDVPEGFAAGLVVTGSLLNTAGLAAQCRASGMSDAREASEAGAASVQP